MCEFARSKEEYRFSTSDWADLIPEAKHLGVRFVRFTGGEPLLHREIVQLTQMSTDAGFLTSLITNGFLLHKKIDQLAGAGLNLLVVSLDGSSELSHDSLRDSPGLFQAAITGIRLARERGIKVRVNTVVGPHNYREMPDLKRVLTDLGVSQWELSTLKIDKPLVYEDEDDVLRVGAKVFDASTGLIPDGIPWYGADERQRERYFKEGIAPGPTGSRCNVVKDILYVDGKNKDVFTCSCLSHREGVVGIGRVSDRISLESQSVRAQQSWYYENGPESCTGCSSTAARYSQLVDELGTNLPEWSI